MTTYNLTGINVAETGGIATANPTAATISFVASVNTNGLNFMYEVEPEVSGDFGATTLDVDSADTLLGLMVNGVAVDAATDLAIAEYKWTEGTGDSAVTKASLVLRVATGSGTYAYFVIDGDALPDFADADAYNAFIADLDLKTSVRSEMDDLIKREGYNLYANQFAETQTENDTLTAADGYDWTGGISTGRGADVVTGGAGDDVIDASYYGTNATLQTNDTDTVDGGAGNDTITAGYGADVLIGGLGNDSVSGGDGNDILEGDHGDDVLRGGNGADIVSGDDGNDSIFGDTGADTLSGNLGDDTINGGSGADLLFGNDGADSMNGGTGVDTMFGGAGSDTMVGGDGNDYLDGQTDSDSVDGGLGNDTLWGDDGNDTLLGGDGSDRMNGEADNDSLNGATGNDTLTGDDGDDTILGGAGVDAITGDAGNDSIDGGSGSDSINGGAGNDIIVGGIGSDTLNGADGNDTMNGGSGSDTFVFQGDHDSDVINGFQNNIDTLQVNFGSIDTWDELRALAVQSGDNVVITFEDDDIVTINNMTIANLRDDVIFS
jgi:Ca2+-binding RTX toxin-like protein